MKKKIVLLLLLTLIISQLSTSFAAVDQIELDQAYEDGAYWGDDTGRIYGYKDFINENDSDWNAAFVKVFPNDSYIEDFFNLEEDYNDPDQKDLNDAFINGLQDAFQQAYQEGYSGDELGTADAEAETIDLAIEHGEFFGDLDGYVMGKKAFVEGENNDFSDYFPNEINTKFKYNLNNDVSDYREYFLKSYKTYFQIAFERGYREANVNTINAGQGTAYEHGYALGYSAGEFASAKDYAQKNLSNWKKAFDAFDDEMNLFTRYNLYLVNEDYKEGFIAAFKEGYEIGYVENYLSLNAEVQSRNTNYKKLISEESEIAYSLYNVEYIDGNKTSFTTTPVSLLLPAGSVYTPNAYIGISESPMYFANKPGKSAATNVYQIDVLNDGKDLILQKDIQLRFPFYGDTRASIYKYVNSQWLYLPTYFEEDAVVTDIPKGAFNGGLYVVVIDNEYTPSQNLSLHWAYKDLKTFIKRGYIPSNYSPDSRMTRKEFSQMIYNNTYGLKSVSYNIDYNFYDQVYFGTYENAINFMVNKGYMLGVGSNLFDPNGYITYKQVEIVMNRIMGDDFTWQEIENDMLIDRFHQSQANDYLSNSVPRSEIIYMLNNVLGDQVLFEE